MEALLNSDSDYLNLYIIPWGINLIMALLIFVLGRWIAKGVSRLAKRLMEKAVVEEILARPGCASHSPTKRTDGSSVIHSTHAGLW